jgi:hypothetical protein
VTPAGQQAAEILHRAYADTGYRNGQALPDMKSLALTVDVGTQAEREVCDSGTQLSRLVAAGSLGARLA